MTKVQKHKEKEWRFLEKVEKIRPFPVMIGYLFALTRGLKRFIRDQYQELITVFEKDTCWIYGKKEDCLRVGKSALKEILHNKKFIQEYRKKLIRRCNNLVRYSEKLFKENLAQVSNQKLLESANKYFKLYFSMFSLGVIPNTLDYASESIDNLLIDKLVKILRKKVSNSRKISEYFTTLTSPLENTLSLQERKDLLNLAENIYKERSLRKLFAENDSQFTKQIIEIKNKELNKAIEEHLLKYAWMSYKFIGPIWWDKLYLIETLKELVIRYKKTNKEIKKLNLRIVNLKKQKAEIKRKLRLSKKELSLFKIVEDLLFLKAYRSDMMAKSFFHFSKVLEELERRTKIQRKYIEYLAPEEIIFLFSSQQIDIKTIKKRVRKSIYIISKKEVKVVIGSEAGKLIKALKPKEKTENISQLKGTVASPGKVKGIIKIINDKKDISKIKEKEIMATYMGQPALIKAMKKAAAIIADFGGITCHAAIVSRELGIPCIIGTKIATKVLRDGDLVEVDANKGVVKILKE